MLCLPVLADTAWISQLAEITQFIFGRPLRQLFKFLAIPPARLFSQLAASISASRHNAVRSRTLQSSLLEQAVELVPSHCVGHIAVASQQRLYIRVGPPR